MGIRLRQNELSLPAQRGTQIGPVGIETVEFAFHAAPPAAFRIARLRQTRASWTL